MMVSKVEWERWRLTQSEVYYLDSSQTGWWGPPTNPLLTTPFYSPWLFFSGNRLACWWFYSWFSHCEYKSSYLSQYQLTQSRSAYVDNLELNTPESSNETYNTTQKFFVCSNSILFRVEVVRLTKDEILRPI